MLNIFRKTQIDSIADCTDCQKGKTAVVVGAGGTLREFAEPIKKLIAADDVFTIGINKMTGICIPNYHLWTNKQRWRDFGDCIDSKKSKMIFGAALPKKLIKKHFTGDYTIVNYQNSPDGKIDYKDGTIFGDFRTAGSLAIFIAHLFGAAKIYIVGMDGYTLHGREALKDGSQSQHVYGKGFTDDADWDQCVEKDRLVYQSLNALDVWGVDFKIITPTKFDKFYDAAIIEKLLQEA